MAVIEVLNSAPRQRGARRNRNKQIVVSGSGQGQAGRSNNIIVPVRSTALVRQPEVRITQQRAQKVKNSKPGISQCGLDFLKCAFSSPDFDSTGALGIPDNYVGRTLCSNQTFSGSGAANAGLDTYILVSPFFGSAFLTGTATIGAMPGVFTSQNWPGYANLGLGSAVGGGSSSVTRFRYASLAAELQPTMNEMTWVGNITSYRVPFDFAVMSAQSTAPSTIINYAPNGLNAINVTPFNNIYTAPFNKGAYAVSFNRTGSFDFRDLVTNALNPATSNTFVNPGGPNVTMPFWGCDDLDTIVFKISVPAGAADQSFILRTWACVELQVVPSSFIYEFTTLSCPHDQAALEMYKYIAERLPVAVPYVDNANFWKRVYAFIRSASRALSHVPGPVGMAAGGLSMITDAFGGMSI